MTGQADEGRLVAGRYRLRERIGRGGMGTVWRAEDELLGRQVAVKKLHPPQPHMLDDELATLFERTRREARAAARISHPNVVVVHDVVDDEGLPSIVMEYVPSVTLGERLKKHGPLPVAEVARIGRGMIAALRAAHRAGVLHRDVKPGNVLLGLEGGSAGDDDTGGYTGGRVVLTDFGIAQASGTSTLTRTGELIGSIDFLSPERIRGAPPGPEADLWALGATLYQAVQGESPFRRPTAIETAYAIAEEPVVPAANAGPLDRVIAGLLAKEPAERLSAEDAERMLRIPASEQDTALVDAERFTSPAPLAEQRTATALDRPAEFSTGAQADKQYGHPPPPPPAPTTPSSPYANPYATAQQPSYDSSSYRSPYGTGYQGSAPPPYSTGTGTGPQQPQPPRRRRTAPWIAAAVVLLLVAAGTALVVLHKRDSGNDAGPGPTTPVSTPPTGSPTPTTPSPAPTTTAPPPPVPEGYHLDDEADHFYSVPVPDDWKRQVSKDGDQVDFIDPTGKADLKISSLDFGSDDPYQHWITLEPQTKQQVGPTYHRERMVRTEQLGLPAALWEFTFQGTARKFHAIDLGFGKPGGREYAVYLSAPDAQWDTFRPVFTNATAGFRLSNP
ncbi:serine/threonine-protein kinase [Actinacidiphila alni]|uniref:serine/threonine-protein kinase n=1 Tax=Actinacidiphila alni TaxID=380248 RepID=UPI0034540636